MANGHRNTVPLGQVGTGAAYVLGPNLALQQWMGNVQQQQNMRSQAEQHNAQINRRNYDAFNRQLSQLQPSSGMYSSDINALLAEHVNKGAELMSRGINPYAPDYSNPDAAAESQRFLQEENYIKAAQGTLQQYEKQRAEALKEYNKNPNNFDYDSFMALMEFEKNNTVADVIEGRATLPNLERTFDMGDFVKKNIGTPKTTSARYEKGEDGQDYIVEKSGVDAEQLLNNVVNSFKSGQGANYLNRQLRDAGSSRDASSIIGTVDANELREIIDQELRTPEPGNRVANLMLEGVIPSFNSPEYERFLDAEVTEQLRAEQVASRVFNQAAQVALGQADSSVKVSPTWDLVKEADRKKAARQRDVRFAERNLKDTDSPDGISTTDFRYTFGDGESTTLENFISFPIATKSLLGETAISRDTGTQETIENSDDYKINGLAVVSVDSNGNLVPDGTKGSIKKPMVTASRSFSSKGTTVTEDVLLEMTSLPVNLPNREAGIVNRWKSQVQGQQSRQSVTRDYIRSLLRNPDYSGYTEKELEEFYKSQGYEVK